MSTTTTYTPNVTRTQDGFRCTIPELGGTESLLVRDSITLSTVFVGDSKEKGNVTG